MKELTTNDIPNNTRIDD